MDTRIALKAGASLTLMAKGSAVRYTIQNEIGRGGSCIVYHATYQNNAGNTKTVRIKECYPYRLSIVREGCGALLPDACDQKAFEECKKRMYESFLRNDELFRTPGLTNSIANTINIYKENNTIYIVSVYLQGKTLLEHPVQSLKECISFTQSAAAAIQRIHNKGYLYLDVTPQNVFVIDGTTELVQLFDFDSLIPMHGFWTDDGSGVDKISYTQGFAALELQMGRFQKLGAYTDVYGVGALLFYLLFGYAPDAVACETDACYDYKAFRFAGKPYQDKLFFLLTDFFHHTLANYYADRYPDMAQTVQKLEELKRYADTEVSYIISTQVSCPHSFVGRERELEALDSWFHQRSNCLFLTGMGGIGKSFLMRKYLSLHRHQFDAVLYLHDIGSVQRMIADDGLVSISLIKRRKEEGLLDYFSRKFALIREWTAGKRAVLVIDDFCGEVDEEFRSILNADWKVVAITRRDMSAQNFDTLNLQAIQKRSDLYSLFENYAGRKVSMKASMKASMKVSMKVSMQECRYLDDIIDQLRGHTLALTLLARQVANSYLSVKEAAAFARQYGFSHIAPEKIDFVKDQTVYQDTLANIITALFDAGNLPKEPKRILKLLSLFQMPEMDIHFIERLLWLDTKDDFNRLRRDGWISIEGESISIHPVIKESVCAWEWTKEYKAASFRVMEALYGQMEQKERTVQYAEAFLEGCKKVAFLQSSDRYRKLLCQTILNLPREREAYILSHTEELLKEPEAFPVDEALKLFDLAVTFYGEKKDFHAAHGKIMEAKAYVRRHRSGYALGQYYFMLAGFYDDQYDCDDCKNLLDALNKAIFHMKSARNDKSRLLLAKYELSKVIVLIRSGFGKKEEIRKLFHSVKQTIGYEERCFQKRGQDGEKEHKGHWTEHKGDWTKERNQLWTEVVSGYYMGMAWRYALIEPDFASADAYIQKARKFAEKSDVSDLDLIDSILIPHANMLADLNMDEMSIDVLLNGIQICDNYKDILPYVRKERELRACLSELTGFGKE